MNIRISRYDDGGADKPMELSDIQAALEQDELEEMTQPHKA